MGCLNENELLEHADGLTSSERSAEIERHIDSCATCRRVVAELVRSDGAPTRDVHEEPAVVSHVTPVQAAVPSAGDAPPVALVRDALRSDAPHRESIVARSIAGLGAVSIVALFVHTRPFAPEFFERAALIMAGIVVYGLITYASLRRGWYHAAIPYFATVVEVSAFFAITWTAMDVMGPESLDRSPGKPLVGAYVVFTAIRTDPRVCLLAGITAALWYFGLHQEMLASMPPPEAARMPPGMGWFGGSFFIVAGVAGALLARYLIGRAEHAIRAVREQDLFGKYVMHERVGKGGMGEVLRATYCPEGGFQKTVAVKRIRADTAAQPDRIAAFREEARLSAQLAHPNIVTVFDFGRFRGSYMVAMEYVDGISLSALLRRVGPLPPAAVAYLGAELAAGLEYLHTRRGPDGRALGLVHRDLNPPNVLVSRIGEVKLADFGIARAAEALAAEEKRTFAGKIPYAAPEQLRGEPVDGRADLYALGLTLHEAITGFPVFERRGEDALCTSIRPPSLTHPETPGDLESVVLELLRADPDARPTTAGDVRARLLALRGATAPYPQGARLVAECIERARAAPLAAPRARPSSPTAPTAVES